MKWVLKDDDEFSRKGGDWGLVAEAEQRAHTKARNWTRAPWPWGEQKAGGGLVRSRAVEGGEGEAQAREGSLVMHTAERGTSGGASAQGRGRGSRGCQKAEGSGDPGTSHRTNSRDSGACLQAEGGGGALGLQGAPGSGPPLIPALRPFVHSAWLVLGVGKTWVRILTVLITH